MNRLLELVNDPYRVGLRSRSSNHTPPDYRRPLRSQPGGRSPAARQHLGWQWWAFKKALRKKSTRIRATLLGTVVGILQAYVNHIGWRGTMVSLIISIASMLLADSLGQVCAEELRSGNN